MSPRELIDLCDPDKHSREEALQLTKIAVMQDDSMHLRVARMVRDQAIAARPNLKLISRTLEVLDAAAPGSAFFSLLRPILRDCDPQVQSKCVLMLARREADLSWADKLMENDDARLRANVIEGLWDNKSPGVLQLLLRASKDSNHRVVANSAYGLRRLGAAEFQAVVDRMQTSKNPQFRGASAWLIGRIGEPELCPLLKPLVRDPDPTVRKVAFTTLASLRAHQISSTGAA